ncbi:MAG: restriction endonuclease [Betaproteobacteria bacterium]
MPDKNMWMVRAGEGAYAIEDFRSKSVVAIGWGDTDWTMFPGRDAIKAEIAKDNPENSEGQNMAAANQIERFLHEIEVGDRVISYDPDNRRYLVGTIAGEPRHSLGSIEGLPTCRDVKWGAVEVNRDELSVETRNSLGAISTLFRIPESASAEIEAKVSGDAVPAVVQETAVKDEVDLLKDVQARSQEFIKDRISKLTWDQMQDLVAGLLRAMGYKTRISPVGPDRGKDIVASPDGFGFEPPRIVVEVKHRKGQMGSQEVRSFLGGRHKDDKGLYVSTGGFSKEAHYEAERSSIPVTLMDMDSLATAVAEYYDRMDAESKALLPLIRIYWPR